MDPATPSKRARTISPESSNIFEESNDPFASPKKGKEETDSATTHPAAPSLNLPFRFGVEFELLLRPKDTVGVKIPDPDSPVRERREFSLSMLETVAKVLSDAGLDATKYDPSDEGRDIDYNKWNVVLDASICKNHEIDGFYPVEIITPVLCGDDTWPGVIDTLWRALSASFEFRLDTTCGTHIHMSWSHGQHNDSELRSVAKAVAFWEPATARCCPPSRQDRATKFCQSNLKGGEMKDVFEKHGPLRGLPVLFERIDKSSRDEIVELVSPDRLRAWNLLPSKTGKCGSVEFRRPPGVVTAKKAKHWIAFTMAFVHMAIVASPEVLAQQVASAKLDLGSIYHPTFVDDLQQSAKDLGVWAQLDARLLQVDNVDALHISMVPGDGLDFLDSLSLGYKTGRG